MSDFTPAERWATIPSHPTYEASDLGRVWSCITSRVMRPSVDRDGYQYLRLDGRTRRVHRLVLEAFVGPCPPGMECCHGPGGPTDNRLSNLRWDTKSANARDQLAGGTHWQRNKSHCPRGHELNEANNVPAYRGTGHRTCLACVRARSYAAARRRRGEYVEDTYATGDAHYARLMRENGPAA